MINYRTQDACLNCKHVFRYVDYDGAGDWYCNLRNDRPPCGSVALGESENLPKRWITIWGRWSTSHFVQPSGICDSWLAMVPEVQPVTTRIQLRRSRGWRLPAGAVVVARPSKWGNPYKVAEHGQAGAVALYRAYLAAMSPDELAAYLAPLRGATALACWCKPGEPCHADVILEHLNA